MRGFASRAPAVGPRARLALVLAVLLVLGHTAAPARAQGGADDADSGGSSSSTDTSHSTDSGDSGSSSPASSWGWFSGGSSAPVGVTGSGVQTQGASWGTIVLWLSGLLALFVACGLCVACNRPGTSCYRWRYRHGGAPLPSGHDLQALEGGGADSAAAAAAAAPSEWIAADRLAAPPIADWLSKAPVYGAQIYPFPSGRHVWPGFFAGTAGARVNAGRTGVLTDLEFTATPAADVHIALAPAAQAQTQAQTQTQSKALAVTGGGRDKYGAFTIAGAYNPATAYVAWTKRYAPAPGKGGGGGHDVAYRGVWHGDARRITGQWFVAQLSRGFAERGVFECTAPAAVNAQLLSAQPLPNPTPAPPGAVTGDGSAAAADVVVAIAAAPTAAATSPSRNSTRVHERTRLVPAA